MPQVLLTTYSRVLGGAERVLLGLAGALEAELWLACPAGPLADAATAAGIRVAPLRARRVELRATRRDRPDANRLLAAARLLAYARDVRALARDLDPDLLVACGMRAGLAASLALPVGTAPVVLQHDDMLPGPVIGRAVRAAARRAGLIVVPSQAVARDLGVPARTVVVHPGVDLEHFRGLSGPVAPPEILVLGALVAWKRPDLALETFALARASRPDLRLRLVGATLGEPSERLLADLRERAERPDLAGSVQFAGAVDDPAPELARASVLLHCAEREPFGLAVLEALAAGRPVVVPSAGGVAEIVDSGCAISFPPGDAAAAAAGIVALLEDRPRAAAMGAHGRELAERRFARADSVRRYAEAVQTLVRPAVRSVLCPPGPVAPAGERLALVTVTHNSERELAALLGSVERHLPGIGVVVVDSGSSDGTVALAQAWRGRAAVTVIALTDNVGFGTACNAGVAATGAAVVGLVNPDVELLDGSLGVLAGEALRRDRPERLLAPLVLSADGSRQDTVHPVPASLPDLLRAVLPPATLPGRLGVELAPWRSRRTRPVGWAVGCALLARAHTLRRLGPFDEQIFMYGEDLDLGLRASAAGVPTIFWPRARVLHHGAHASAPTFGGEPFERLARARHDVVARRLGARRARLDDLAQALTFRSRIAVKGALGRDTARERRQLDALGRAVV